MVERCHTPIAFHEIACLKNRCLHHFATLRIHWSIATATSIRTPTENSCHTTSAPPSAKPLRKTPTISAPIRVPVIDPLPPKRLVPPITTAVIESTFREPPASGLAAPTRPNKIHAPIPQLHAAIV